MADGIVHHATQASRHRRSWGLIHPRAQGPTLQVPGGVQAQPQRAHTLRRSQLRSASGGPPRQEEDHAHDSYSTKNSGVDARAAKYLRLVFRNKLYHLREERDLRLLPGLYQLFSMRKALCSICTLVVSS